MPAEVFVNGTPSGIPATTINASVFQTDTSLTVVSTSWIPVAQQTGQFRILVGTERMLVQYASTTSLTVVGGLSGRGIENTTAGTHAVGDGVYPILTAGGLVGIAVLNNLPLTSKGDLLGYDTSANRIPIDSDGQVLVADSTQALGVKWASVAGGTVTSVGLTMPSIFSVSGSPVTSVGTLAATLATQTANQVFAGPASGSAAAPTFRALVPSDYPAFVASGASHTQGAVPDPGSTAGTARFLREDATWAITPIGDEWIPDVFLLEGDML